MKSYRSMWSLILCLLIVVSGCGPALEAERIDPGEIVETPTSTTPEVFAIGDTVSIGDFRITVNKTRQSAGSEWFKPDEGHVWLIVECTIENAHSKEPQIVSSLLMFDLVDEDGRSMNTAIGPETKGRLDGEIGVGRKMTGELAWEVPVDAKGLELIFAPGVFQKGQAIFSLGDW